MIRHHFKVIYRQMLRSKVYALLNIGGLSLGMVVAIFIGLWVHDELTYNQYHDNYDQMVQLLTHSQFGDRKVTNTFMMTAVGSTLTENFPDAVEEVFMAEGRANRRVIAYGQKSLREVGLLVTANAPNMLGFDMIAGSQEGLIDKYSIMLSESFAKRLFGTENPMNKTVKVAGRTDLLVTGVYKDIPNNSRFSYANYTTRLVLTVGDKNMNIWDNFNVKVYAKMSPEANLADIGSALNEFTAPHYNQNDRRRQVFLHPMKDWHLRSEFEDFMPVMSQQMKFVWLYGLIGVFVLILACINFTNLSTARSEKRAKESGIRKTLGSIRRELIAQFYIETSLYALLSYLLALGAYVILLPWFNELSGKSIQEPWQMIGFWGISGGFLLITVIAAGSYPALYLSSFSPVRALKGKFSEGNRASIPRKVLVVVQYTISIALIVGTITVNNQIQTAKNRPVGYSPEGMISLERASPNFSKKMDVLKAELLNTGLAQAVGSSNYPVVNNLGWNGGFTWDGMDENFDKTFNTINISPGYARAVGMKFILGRDFSEEFGNDHKAIIINRTAMELMQLEDPIGMVVNYNPSWKEAENYTIIGVVEDMIKNSPFEKTDQSIMFFDESWIQYLYIRLNPNSSVSEALVGLEEAFHKVLPNDPFDYSFADDDYERKFLNEQRISEQASFFSVVAIFISCLGLFGLAAFLAEQRIKEIGIRKVLGATVTHILTLLSKEFIVLMVIASFVAIPIAYQVLDTWLNSYEIRTSIHWWFFGLAGFGALMLTLLTTGFHAVKAALANPVQSLRSE
ncbi:MAG: FtsX-like permease family protein [Cytophagales bacterium]|nr:FtsX-like permease family protein [Cytophagales bacterium]